MIISLLAAFLHTDNPLDNNYDLIIALVTRQLETCGMGSNLTFKFLKAYIGLGFYLLDQIINYFKFTWKKGGEEEEEEEKEILLLERV